MIACAEFVEGEEVGPVEILGVLFPNLVEGGVIVLFVDEEGVHVLAETGGEVLELLGAHPDAGLVVTVVVVEVVHEIVAVVVEEIAVGDHIVEDEEGLALGVFLQSVFELFEDLGEGTVFHSVVEVFFANGHFIPFLILLHGLGDDVDAIELLFVEIFLQEHVEDEGGLAFAFGCGDDVEVGNIEEGEGNVKDGVHLVV